MRLRQVTIQGYRSLYDVTLCPDDFRVVIGPNNAGKSNLFDALQFLGDAAKHGLEVAIGRQGGYENLAFRRERRRRRPLRFTIDAELSRQDIRRTRIAIGGSAKMPFAVHYTFDVRASSESREADYRVSHEELTVVYGNQTVVAAQRDGSSISSDPPTITQKSINNLVDPMDDSAFWDYMDQVTEPTELMLSRLTYSALTEGLLAALGRTRLFQLSPVECRKAGAATPAPELGRHGANLPGVVRYMRVKQPDAWAIVMRAMERIMPSLVEVRTEFTPDRQLALIFEESGRRRWTANEVSDGTVQSLGLFVALFDQRIPLVLIEEPENALHPWIIRAFADACREVEHKQILVTTHSPALISYLQPDELDLMWRTDDDGQSHIASLTKLDPEAQGLWERGDTDLFQLIDGGWIREAVPPGLR